MIMYLYSSRNRKSGQYGKLTTELYNADQIKELYAVSVKEAQESERVYLRELEVYCVGTLDTETGLIIPQNTFILDVGSLLGSVEHGKEEVVEQSV